MNIVDSTIIQHPTLGIVATGTVFKYADKVYMKLNGNRYVYHDFQVVTPVVVLSDGMVTLMGNDTVIQVVEAELHIK
jgi:hypothetical protein